MFHQGVFGPLDSMPQHVRGGARLPIGNVPAPCTDGINFYATERNLELLPANNPNACPGVKEQLAINSHSCEQFVPCIRDTGPPPRDRSSVIEYAGLQLGPGVLNAGSVRPGMDYQGLVECALATLIDFYPGEDAPDQAVAHSEVARLVEYALCMQYGPDHADASYAGRAIRSVLSGQTGLSIDVVSLNDTSPLQLRKAIAWYQDGKISVNSDHAYVEVWTKIYNGYTYRAGASAMMDARCVCASLAAILLHEMVHAASPNLHHEEEAYAVPVYDPELDEEPRVGYGLRTTPCDPLQRATNSFLAYFYRVATGDAGGHPCCLSPPPVSHMGLALPPYDCAGPLVPTVYGTR